MHENNAALAADLRDQAADFRAGTGDPFPHATRAEAAEFCLATAARLERADHDPQDVAVSAVEKAAEVLRSLERTHGPDLDVMGIDSDVAAEALAEAGVLKHTA